MPADVRQLHADDKTTGPANQRAKDVLSFLGSQKDKAYTLEEIADNLITVRGTEAVLPWNPLLVGLRTLDLAATVDELNRSGQVVRVRKGNREWFHLPE